MAPYPYFLLILISWEIEASEMSLGGASENTSGGITVKSRRLVQRRLKRRKIPMTPKVEDQELPISTYKHPHSKIMSAGSDPDDPYRLFLSGSNKNPLLSPKEEQELVNKVHVCASFTLLVVCFLMDLAIRGCFCCARQVSSLRLFMQSSYVYD